MIRRFLLFFAGCILLVPVGSAQGQPLPDGAQRLTLRDEGQTVLLAVGQELDVRLQANRTTGYAWSLTGFDEVALARLGDPVYRQDPETAGRMGAGGSEVWRFRAVRTGMQTLCFEYRRSWEGAVPPARRAVYFIEVR